MADWIQRPVHKALAWLSPEPERRKPWAIPRGMVACSVKILVVDHDPAFCSRTTAQLGQAGIACCTVPAALEARQILAGPDACTIDIVILNVDLPEATRWTLLGELRATGNPIPVVFVTERPSSVDRVQGLNRGGDDYMAKTIAQDELVARLHAVLRRTFRGTRTRIQDLTIDPVKRRTERGGKAIDLTPREFEVLWALAQASGRAVSQKELLSSVWGIEFEPTTNLVQVHVHNLRKKLEAGTQRMIDTVRGQGYRLIA